MYPYPRECVRKEFGEELDLSASLRPRTSTDTVYLEYISGFFYLVSSSKVILLFSFVRGSSSVLVADTLEEGP